MQSKLVTVLKLILKEDFSAVIFLPIITFYDTELRVCIDRFHLRHVMLRLPQLILV